MLSPRLLPGGHRSQGHRSHEGPLVSKGVSSRAAGNVEGVGGGGGGVLPM